jgi:hypothetical protein
VDTLLVISQLVLFLKRGGKPKTKYPRGIEILVLRQILLHSEISLSILAYFQIRCSDEPLFPMT